MKKKGFKRLLAGILTGAMALSMNMTAFAASPQADGDVIGLSPYGDTPYTTYVTLGDAATTTVNLFVTGLTTNTKADGTTEYVKTPLDIDQADAVEWNVTTPIDDLDGSIENEAQYIDNEWVSSCSIDTSSLVRNPGYAVVQAKLDGLQMPTLDFTIVFNPSGSVTPVTGITCKFMEGTKELASVDVGSVGASDIPNSTKYPNALYATKLAQNKDGVGTIEGFEDGYITSVTIGTKTYDSAGGYWMYALEDAAHNPITASENVGASVYPLQNGYTIIWTYTAY